MNKDEVETQSNQREQQTKTSRLKQSNNVILVPYPKIIFLYPTFVMSIIAAVCTHYDGFILNSVVKIAGSFSENELVISNDVVRVVVTVVFLYIVTINLVVLAFDFPRATSLTLLFFLATFGLAGALTFTFYPDLLPQAVEVLKAIRPTADATFYACLAVIMGVIFVGVFFSVRFNYWEVTPNEILHHHGILSDLKRYPTLHMQVDKEINDVFEYMLLGSGRLILQPTNSPKAIVLDNVPLISRRERDITRLLGLLRVQVTGDSNS